MAFTKRTRVKCYEITPTGAMSWASGSPVYPVGIVDLSASPSAASAASQLISHWQTMPVSTSGHSIYLKSFLATETSGISPLSLWQDGADTVTATAVVSGMMSLLAASGYAPTLVVVPSEVAPTLSRMVSGPASGWPAQTSSLFTAFSGELHPFTSGDMGTSSRRNREATLTVNSYAMELMSDWTHSVMGTAPTALIGAVATSGRPGHHILNASGISVGANIPDQTQCPILFIDETDVTLGGGTASELRWKNIIKHLNTVRICLDEGQRVVPVLSSPRYYHRAGGTGHDDTNIPYWTILFNNLLTHGITTFIIINQDNEPVNAHNLVEAILDSALDECYDIIVSEAPKGLPLTEVSISAVATSPGNFSVDYDDELPESPVVSKDVIGGIGGAA